MKHSIILACILAATAISNPAAAQGKPSSLPMTQERKAVRACMAASIQAQGVRESYPISCAPAAGKWCKQVGGMYSDADVCDVVTEIEYRVMTRPVRG